MAPVSRAILETACSGMRLQIWRKTLNRDRVGLIFLFFMPAVWQVQRVKPTLFSICLWDGCDFFPFLAGMVPILVLTGAFWYDKKRRENRIQAPQTEKLLRPPGYSLSIRL